MAVSDVILEFEARARLFVARVAGIPTILVPRPALPGCDSQGSRCDCVRFVFARATIPATQVRAAVVSVRVERQLVEQARDHRQRRRRAALQALIEGIQGPEPKQIHFRLR